MAQAVTMFDGWFAGQRLSTTQRYLQVTLVTANAIVKLNFQLSVSRPHFFFFVLFLLFNSSSFFFNVQLHRYTTRTQRKKKKRMRNALGSPFNNCLKETKKKGTGSNVRAGCVRAK
jgi:hypothetical protein